MKIYFVGIKGVGMTPLAVIAREAGCKVTGSDIAERFITDEVLEKAGIFPLVGFDKKNVQGVDLVITTGAHGGFDNEEVIAARDQNIPVMTQGEAVGVFMHGDIFGKKLVGISVAGSHGKTTTTAMIATLLKASRMDPSFLVGTGDVPSLGGSGHFGKGQYFVAEADEYATEPTHDKTPKLLWQHPRYGVVTNIDFDHSDMYDSIADVTEAFKKFVQNIQAGGALIVNGDDEEAQKVIKTAIRRVITFGKNSQNDYVITKAITSGQQTFFWLESGGASLGEFRLSVIGEHNSFNATAALIAALECGIPLEEARAHLGQFTGTKRRSEYKGKTAAGALVYDDYAHHPVEIQKTLAAFRSAFPREKLIVIFQPHTYSRTKIMFEQFIHSFGQADEVVFTDIFSSQREAVDLSVSSRLLAEEAAKFHKGVLYASSLSDVVEYIDQKKHPETAVIITMGAGDVYKICDSIVTKK